MILRKVIMCCMAVLLAGCHVVDDENGVDPVQVGDPVPSFSVTLQDGSVFESLNPASWPAVIVFFHTSCVDCQTTLPVIQQAYDRFQSMGVRFVCIARAEGSAQIQNFWQSHRLTLPWSAQEDRSVYSLFAASRIPRVYVVDRTGVVKAIYDDNPCPSYEDLSASILSVSVF